MTTWLAYSLFVQGSAKRLIKAALQEAARKREMCYLDLMRIDKKVRWHFLIKVASGCICVYCFRHRVPYPGLLLYLLYSLMFSVKITQVMQRGSSWSRECSEGSSLSSPRGLFTPSLLPFFLPSYSNKFYIFFCGVTVSISIYMVLLTGSYSTIV
jgi:hypothetical protein